MIRKKGVVMKKFLIIAVFTFSIIFLNSSNTYAYSIETLDSNPDYTKFPKWKTRFTVGRKAQ